MVPANKPFIMFLAETLAIIVKPNKANAKYSGALKRSAKSAKIGATAINTMVLINPPIKEATAAMLNAFAAKPLMAMVCPSNTVAAEAGVPGVFNKIAAIEPP